MAKNREHATVKAFLDFARLPLSSVIEWRESPDALVRLGGTIVGIEVTQLVEATPRQPTAPQKWKAEANRIVGDAQASFERRYSVALVVGIEFRPEWRPPAKRRPAGLADGLAALVERLVPPEVLAGGPLRKPIQRKDPQHPDVASVYVGHTKQSLGGSWAPLFAHKIQGTLADDIDETVKKKEPKVEAYRRAAPDVWLLIDCDLSGQGLALDVPEPSFTVITNFGRVFCCGFGMWQWVEIPTVRPLTHAAAHLAG